MRCCNPREQNMISLRTDHGPGGLAADISRRALEHLKARMIHGQKTGVSKEDITDVIRLSHAAETFGRRGQIPGIESYLRIAEIQSALLSICRFLVVFPDKFSARRRYQRGPAH